MEQLIIGTAGHVDHGKTVLIKALTGMDTDRFQEEKERGISIDLGFAPFKLPDGRLAGVIDVPGHEKFIHNMLAGAGGMDLVMLVIDATEGVMPQTREHLDILELLGTKNGIVVITKIDLVEEEWRELVQDEIREELAGTFLEDATIHAVAALQGAGIEELKELIHKLTLDLEPRDSSGPLRLPVDRSFVISGFGTVITGTLIQGSVRVGDIVSIVPPGIEVRVRNIQVHDTDVKEAGAGTRVALNLSGLEKDQVLRGSVISNPGYYRQTDLIDVSVELLEKAPRKLKNLDPVHFFLGTARTVARMHILDKEELLPGQSALVQCRLEKPLVTERGDPFVVRSYSPMTTIGGGKVLDPFPERHRRFRTDVIERLHELEQAPAAGGDSAFVRRKLEELVAADIFHLVKETRMGQAKVEDILKDLIAMKQVKKIGETYLLTEKLKEFEEKLIQELERFHQKRPLAYGISRARLKGFLPPSFNQREYDALLDNLEERELIFVKNNLVAKYGFEPEPSASDREKIDKLSEQYRQGWLQPPSIGEAFEKAAVKQDRKDELYNYLVSNETLIKISEDLYFHRDAYNAALDLLRKHFTDNQQLTLAEFRDLSGSSRKFAQALLEHFDQVKITRRVEDHRVPNKL
ncbi:MAG: selenocysteine-specific translation elongation factor [Bacillota bacterium]